LRKVKDLKHKEKFNGERSDVKGKKPMKKQRREEMNQGEEMGEENDNEHIVFALNELLKITFDDSEEGQFFNFDEPDVNDSSEYTPCLIEVFTVPPPKSDGLRSDTRTVLGLRSDFPQTIFG
jgi:hypothetical protein